MAEALAVISVVANIIQLADFSSKVLHRLEEFRSDLGEIPRSFRHFSAELPVLKATLQQIGESIVAGSVGVETEKALIPAIEGCTEQIQLLDTLLAKILPIATDSRLRRGTKAVLSLSQETKVESITKILRGYVGTLTFYYAAISSTLQPQTDAKLAKIRQWLSPPDPSPNYQKAVKQRQADTGLWFLEGESYAAWKTNPASFIWLYGIPGCGKTILSSTVLQSILQCCADDPGKAAAYFYFDFNDAQKQSPELMIRSLVSQLSQQCVKIPTTLATLFSSCENGLRQPPLLGLLEVMRSMMQEFPQSYIVLDALDECTDRAELMAILEKIAEWKLDASHVLVTSRRERDIESSLEVIVDPQNTICLQRELVDRDIRTYVRQRLSDDKSLSKWQKDSEVRHEIEMALVKGAHGMFRWAVCQLDTIGRCRNRLKLRESLASLPSTLDETYDRILRAIDTEDSEYAVRILRWLAFSSRPLLVEEIAEAVAIDVNRKPAFNREEVLEDPSDILSICSSLVTITAATTPTRDRYPPSSKGLSKIVALAHYSVKEYLISERSRQSVARYSMQDIACNEFIAKSCIGYLLQFQEPGPLSLERIYESKLALYAADFWITHTQAVSQDAETLNDLILDLFSTGRGAYENWVQIYNLHQHWGEDNFIVRYAKVPAPLYYASLGRLTEIVELLLRKGADVNEQGSNCGSALQAASSIGHDKIVQLLLSNGAYIDAHGREYGSALQAASSKGHDKIVELLLSKGADVNVQGGYHGSALQVASSGGYTKIVELLLSKGADVNAQGGEYGNALQAASFGGYNKIVERLLSKGADINAQGGEYSSALYAASSRGHDKIVELLLSSGAEINAQGGFCGSALQAASSGGYTKIVELLLSKGADVNAQGGEYGNALQAASFGGYNKIVERLLSKGADINAQGGEYNSALYAASFRGHDKIVELLLSNGADVNAQVGDYSSVLQVASFKGHDKIVELLLSRGADINAQGGYFGSALQAASYGGYDKIIELLQTF